MSTLPTTLVLVIYTCSDSHVLPLQGRLDAIDVDKAVEFVLSCMNFDGGFGCRPCSETHSGMVNKVLLKVGKKMGHLEYHEIS